MSKELNGGNWWDVNETEYRKNPLGQMIRSITKDELIRLAAIYRDVSSDFLWGELNGTTGKGAKGMWWARIHKNVYTLMVHRANQAMTHEDVAA